MPERRAHNRKKLVLPVRLTVANETEFVHTLDLTSGGAKIGNVRSELEVGKLVTLSRGSHRAKFRVAWIHQIGPKDMQVGLEALQQDNNLLGVDLLEGDRTSSEEFLMTLLTSRKSK